MVNTSKYCKRCNTRLINEHGTLKCPACGWERVSIQERKRYYESHKEEILTDIDKLGRPKTEKKWQIPSSSLTSLLKRWGLATSKQPAKGAKTPSTKNLPALPPWSNNWQPEVQIKWLSLFERMLYKK